MTDVSGGKLRLLIDIDGVLYRGNAALPGVAELFEWIGRSGHSYTLVTNNASRTPQEIADKLLKLGIRVDTGEIMTSAIATARWLRAEAPKGARVQVLGGPGLLQAMFAPESSLLPDWTEPEWIVVGADFDVTYQKLAAACLAVQRGARFVGTNPDTTFPTEQGLTPGAGALQRVITLVTGIEPIIIGKPETTLYQMALAAMPEEGQVLVIGDRLDTDILAGQRLGIPTALVLTGVSTRDEAERGQIEPDHIFQDLPELVAHFDRD